MKTPRYRNKNEMALTPLVPLVCLWFASSPNWTPSRRPMVPGFIWAWVKRSSPLPWQAYYNETVDSPTRQKQLFEAVTGGLQFDTIGITADITKAKGYAQFFSNYLGYESVFSAEECSLIKQKISSLRDWSVATADSGMTATDTQGRGAFMLGNDGADNLTGGAGNDANTPLFERKAA